VSSPPTTEKNQTENVLVCHNSLLVTIGVDQIHDDDLLSGVAEKLFLAGAKEAAESNEN